MPSLTAEDHLRDLLGEPIPPDGSADDTFFSDEKIVQLLEMYPGLLYAAAIDGWQQKAAFYQELIDVSEGGTERRFSQLYAQANRQVQLYTKLYQLQVQFAFSPFVRVAGRGADVTRKFDPQNDPDRTRLGWDYPPYPISRGYIFGNIVS